jgi:DnaJ-class molecular chaperone
VAASKSDYYDILGVSKGASAEEIKKAYRKQALEWHPDRHKDEKEAAEKRFKEINEAYQVLSDTQKRSAYDQYGHSAFAPGGGSPFSGGGQGNPFSSYTYYSNSGGGQGNPFASFDFGDPFDIFEQFFGGGSPFRQARQIPRYSLTLDFMEAVKGCEREVIVEGKKRKIKIPAGVDEGSRINFNDFILSLNVKQDELFERDGEDVYVKVGIPFSMAVFGGDIKVPTIDGELKLKIRPGTQSGIMVRLRERGIKSLRHRGHGDEYVKINVITPEKLNREQKKVIEELKDRGF